MVARASSLAARDPGDFVEFRIEKRDGVTLSHTPDGLCDITRATEAGCHARVLRDGVWGTGSISSDEDPAAALARAGAAARTPGLPGRAVLARPPASRGFHGQDAIEHPSSTPLRDKAFLCRRYCDLLSSETSGAPCRVSYRDFSRTRAVISSAGAEVVEEEVFCGFRMDALAPGTGLSASRDMAGRAGLEFFRGREGVVDEVARECADLALAVPAPGVGGRFLLDGEMAGVFVHEVFGHLCESGAHPLSPATDGFLIRGARVADACVSIVDDATLMHMPGSHRFDDEGVPGARTEMVSAGRLVTRLHTLETAGAEGTSSTGNARAVDFRSPPSARMTCTILSPGDLSTEALLAMLSDGLYLQGSLHGSTDMGTFSLTSRKGRIVKSGCAGSVTGPVTITGRVFDFLRAIEAVGAELVLRSGSGGCSSSGSGMIPVSFGAPHVLISGGLPT